MKFCVPEAGELRDLRADPLLVEQELDVRPAAAEAIERAVGARCGRVYWRSAHDHLYALELGDLGRGRPSTATVYGHWDRWEPRPPEHEIDADLLDLCLWVATVTPGMDSRDVAKVAQYTGVKTAWPEGTVLRTSDERFAVLPDFPYQPKYVDVEGLRMAYVEAGEGDPILLLHGEPAWGYLYRRMIPALANVGRVIVPDLIGFGRSDKPIASNAYSIRSHVRWLRGFVCDLDLSRVTMVGHDWGGSLGMRVLAETPERFVRLVTMNTGISPGGLLGDAFSQWRRFSQRVDFLDVALVINRTLRRHHLNEAEATAYNAPFPGPEYQMAALTFPRLVPLRADSPGAYDNRVAIEKLKTLTLPVLLLWSADDAITALAEPFLRGIFPNVAPPLAIENAGHFIQEDAGEEVAERILEWLGRR